jgi:hypothetical protein
LSPDQIVTPRACSPSRRLLRPRSGSEKGVTSKTSKRAQVSDTSAGEPFAAAELFTTSLRLVAHEPAALIDVGLRFTHRVYEVGREHPLSRNLSLQRSTIYLPTSGSVAEIADRVRTVLPIYRCWPTRRSGYLAHRKTRLSKLQPGKVGIILELEPALEIKWRSAVPKAAIESLKAYIAGVPNRKPACNKCSNPPIQSPSR